MVETTDMQRFLIWLGNLLFGETPKPEEKTLHKTQRRLRAAQVRRRTAVMSEPPVSSSRPTTESSLDTDSELGYRIEDGGPGKNVLVATGGRDADPDVIDQLSILDAEDNGKAGGEFDPYNTGKFDRSSNWSRVNRN